MRIAARGWWPGSNGGCRRLSGRGPVCPAGERRLTHRMIRAYSPRLLVPISRYIRSLCISGVLGEWASRHPAGPPRECGRSQPAQRTIEPALAGTKDHRAGSARWLSDLSGSCDSRRGALAIERRGALDIERRGALDIESVQRDLPPLERGFAGWQFACAVPVEPGGGAAFGVLLVDRLSGVVELKDVGED